MTDTSVQGVRYWRHRTSPTWIHHGEQHDEWLARAQEAGFRDELEPLWTEVVVMTPAELAAIKAEVAEKARADALLEASAIVRDMPFVITDRGRFIRALDAMDSIWDLRNRILARTPDQIGDTP